MEDGIIIKCTVVWGGAILHHQIDYIEAMPCSRKRSSISSVGFEVPNYLGYVLEVSALSWFMGSKRLLPSE